VTNGSVGCSLAPTGRIKQRILHLQSSDFFDRIPSKLFAFLCNHTFRPPVGAAPVGASYRAGAEPLEPCRPNSAH
jgi:hypothetical protein